MVRRAGAAVVLLAVACSPAGPQHLRTSPEPARAPVSTAPEGAVLTLTADDPEGVVVANGQAVLAARRPGALVVVGLSPLQTVRILPVPGAARHLQLAGSNVLLPGEDTDSLSVVDPATGQLLGTARVGDHPHDAVDVAGTTVVTEEDAHSLAFVRDGKVLGRLSGLDTPGGIAGDSDRAAAVEVRGRVLTVVDVARRTVVAKVPVGAGPTHVIALGGGRVAVADTSGDEVLVVQISGRPRVLSRLHLAGKPYGLAFDADRDVLWVATTADNVLHRLLVTRGGLTSGDTWRTVQQPNSLAVVPATGAVVVVGATRPGRVQVITP